MPSYAQTYPQLMNQLRTLRYSQQDLALICKAYELAAGLFSTRYQPSGKNFVAHVIGTASVLASIGAPIELVAAGLLHNVYEYGDFGDGRFDLTARRRARIKRALGGEIEQYVARFRTLSWHSPEVKRARGDLSRLNSVDRGVLTVLAADHLEHLLDFDLLYYKNEVRTRYLSNCSLAAEAADRLGFPSLAAELRELVDTTEAAVPPIQMPPERWTANAFVITAKSARKRLRVKCSEQLAAGAYRFRRYARAVSRPRQSAVRIREALFMRGLAVAPPGRPAGVGRLKAETDEFAMLFSDDAAVERVATGFEFTEGPLWISDDQSLLFSDIPASRIYSLKSDGSVEIFRKPSGNANGLTLDRQGRLIACEHGTRRVSRTERDGSVRTLADEFRGRRLNSPNDVVVKSDGAIYFSDPGYGITPEQQEQPVEGVYRISADGRQISLVAEDLKRPNGLAFSPDESLLYIDDSDRRCIVAFKVGGDGSLSDPSLFHDMNVRAAGAPDGMKADVEGRIYCTGAGGVWVFDARGRHLGTIVTPEKPSNCAWGGEDQRTLYITAVSSVYRVRVKTAGAPGLA